MFALLLIRAFYNHCAALLIAGMLFYCVYSNLLPVQLKSNTFRISSQIYWLAKMSSFALKCVIFFLCVSVCCTYYCIELKCLWRSLRPRLFFGSFNSNWMVVECLFKAAVVLFLSRLKGWIQKRKTQKNLTCLLMQHDDNCTSWMLWFTVRTCAGFNCQLSEHLIVTVYLRSNSVETTQE